MSAFTTAQAFSVDDNEAGEDCAWLRRSSRNEVHQRRECERASSDIGSTDDTDFDDDVTWLVSRGAIADDRARAARRRMSAMRLSAAIGTGCLLSGVAPGTALAPIGAAHASVDQLSIAASLPPIPPITLDAPALPSVPEVSSSVASATLEDKVSEDVVRFGNRAIPRHIVKTILRAAAVAEVDPIYLMALADKESSFSPAVKAGTSSAVGLYQFIERTWLDVVRTFGPKHGLTGEAAAVEMVNDRPVISDESERTRILDLRRDPYLSAVMAAEMLKRDRADIGVRVGRSLSETELYLAHFLGLQDAARFIELREKKNHKVAASRTFPAAARANKAIFFARKGRKLQGLSFGEVYGRLEQMIGSRVSRFQNVTSYASAE